MQQAHDEFNVPIDRLASHMIIESGGDPKAVQVNPTNGNSYGLLQVVPRWWKKDIDRLAGQHYLTERDAGQAMINNPLLAVRCGAYVLKTMFDTHGSWDRASSAFFVGNPNWAGGDYVNGTTAGEYRTRLNTLIADWNGGVGPVTSLTFGNAKHPGYTDRQIPNNTAWDDLGPRNIKAVCLHRMIGTLWGTDGYFRGGAISTALTDYGVGVAAHDERPGEILMWNNPRGNRAPWANGRVSSPYGDGLAFYQKYGVNAVNRDVVSIEISGTEYNVPVDAVAWQEIAKLVAYWADQSKVPHDTFPINPATGISFVLWHQEFTIGTGKICPGPVVMTYTPTLIQRVKALLKQAQTGVAPPPEPVYPKPDPLPFGNDGRDHVKDGATFFACGRVWFAKADGGKCYQGASTTLPEVRAPLKKDEPVIGEYVVWSHGERWVVTNFGTRIRGMDLLPEFPFKEGS